MERGNKERKQRRTNKFHSFAQNHVLHQNRNYLRESPKIKRQCDKLKRQATRRKLHKMMKNKKNKKIQMLWKNNK